MAVKNAPPKRRDPNNEAQAPPAAVVIEAVTPEIDGGLFAIKRTVGEKVVVEADAFAAGHGRVACELLYKAAGSDAWARVRMEALGNDRFRGFFTVERLGLYLYTVRAWIDPFGTWAADLEKRRRAGQDLDVDLRIGSDLIAQAAARAQPGDAATLRAHAATLAAGGEAAADLALSEELALLMDGQSERGDTTTHPRELSVTVDRERARFSTWYEMFPRSASNDPKRPGTLRDCEKLLPYVRSMGFDVLYLPPIHPIGRTHRKGKNNSAIAQPREPGSPWAIGGPEGGHKAIHPELGTLEDFRRLADSAAGEGIEIALDLAFQCTPDHPYVREHPEWFRHRPDGSIQFAENPPKRYEDIYPLDFESPAWRELWEELKSVVLFWIEQGVRIFRVDNPHTKPFAFWQWLIGEIKRDHPETIFLAEAFTRPKVMYRLAKLGFTQSYTYFTWRHTAQELATYFRQLQEPPVEDFFRPSLWPNTPDILSQDLQVGGRPAFVARLVLAATLGASYGIYGPAFELFEGRPREAGSEEYLDSEKYEVRAWERARPDSLREFIARVNRIRRENPALQSDAGLRFHTASNPQILCYSKRAADNVVIIAVNLDPHHSQSAWLELDLPDLSIFPAETFQVHELLTGARYLWNGTRNFIELDPRIVPAQVFRIRRRVRTEQDFDYFL